MRDLNISHHRHVCNFNVNRIVYAECMDMFVMLSRYRTLHPYSKRLEGGEETKPFCETAYVGKYM
jgi:hypothetical protein